MNTENRVSPQAPEIEEAIIGACLIEQRAIPLIADKLRPEMFYVLRHQLIYAAILAMYHAGMKIDILTVKEELSHRGKLEEAGVLETLPQKLQETARFRRENPEARLSELAEMPDPPVSKSAINHRMRKLMELSKTL